MLRKNTSLHFGDPSIPSFRFLHWMVIIYDLLIDWNAVILPVFQFKVLFPYILFPFYIFLSNFILLNIMIALSCEYFIEIEVGMVERGPENRTINKIQDLSKILQKIKMDRVYLEYNNKDLTHSEKMLIQ